MERYTTASGVTTVRLRVELTYDEAVALSVMAGEGAWDKDAQAGLDRIRKTLAVEAPEMSEEPEWARG